MTATSALFASTLLLAAAALPAQVPVTLRCTPTDGSAAGCYYCPGFENVIKWNGTQLHSSTVNIVAFHDLDVVIEGTWNGTVVEVTSIQTDIESFSISGNGTIGHRFDFNTIGPVGSLAINMASFGTAFVVPFGQLALQLDPATLGILGAGAVDNNGELKSRLDIPDDPSLIGLRINGQGIVLPPSGGFYSTNIDAKVVS